MRFRGVHGLHRGGVGEVLDVLPALEPFGPRVSMWRFAIRPRRRSSRGTCWRSRISVGCRPGSATTICKAAVAKVLFGRDRLENERFVALRSHYGFDSFYCRPGIEGATRRAAWRARWADSVAVIWCRCLGWRIWMS